MAQLKNSDRQVILAQYSRLDDESSSSVIYTDHTNDEETEAPSSQRVNHAESEQMTSQTFMMHENSRNDIRCIVNVTNTTPDVKLFINLKHRKGKQEKKTEPIEITNQFVNYTSAEALAQSGGLIAQQSMVTFLDEDGIITPLEYNGGVFKCIASVPRHRSIEVEFHLHITCEYKNVHVNTHVYSEPCKINVY